MYLKSKETQLLTSDTGLVEIANGAPYPDNNDLFFNESYTNMSNKLKRWDCNCLRWSSKLNPSKHANTMKCLHWCRTETTKYGNNVVFVRNLDIYRVDTAVMCAHVKMCVDVSSKGTMEQFGALYDGHTLAEQIILFKHFISQPALQYARIATN